MHSNNWALPPKAPLRGNVCTIYMLAYGAYSIGWGRKHDEKECGLYFKGLTSGELPVSHTTTDIYLYKMKAHAISA